MRSSSRIIDGAGGTEHELIDTVFDEILLRRHRGICQASPKICSSAFHRQPGARSAEITLLPTLWFRNVVLGLDARRPRMREGEAAGA
jgi:hypothetical protein